MIVPIIITIYALIGVAKSARPCIDHLAVSRQPHDIALCVFVTILSMMIWPVLVWERKP